jgi:hypothetical protein
MKKFTKNILFFISLPLILLLLFISYVTISSKSYELDDDVTDLFIGDSQLKEGIDDSKLLDSKNIGMVAESYYFSYYKIKLLIDNTPRVEKIYLAVGYHNLSKLFDVFTNGERSYFYAAPYFYILPFKAKIEVTRWNLGNLNLFVKNIIVSGFNTILGKPSFDGDGFTNNIVVGSSKADVDLRIKDQYYNGDKLEGFSALNILYLEKIITMLKRRKIELTILKMPTGPYYSSKIPESYKIKYGEIMKTHNLKTFEFKELALKDTNYFMPDGDHVNAKGAHKVTQEVKRIQLSN